MSTKIAEIKSNICFHVRALRVAAAELEREQRALEVAVDLNDQHKTRASQILEDLTAADHKIALLQVEIARNKLIYWQATLREAKFSAKAEKARRFLAEAQAKAEAAAQAEAEAKAEAKAEAEAEAKAEAEAAAQAEAEAQARKKLSRFASGLVSIALALSLGIGFNVGLVFVISYFDEVARQDKK